MKTLIFEYLKPSILLVKKHGRLVKDLVAAVVLSSSSEWRQFNQVLVVGKYDVVCMYTKKVLEAAVLVLEGRSRGKLCRCVCTFQAVSCSLEAAPRVRAGSDRMSIT